MQPPKTDAINVWAIVPAAGQGRRYRKAQQAAGIPEQYKQLEPIGHRSMLATVLDALIASQVVGITVVVNPDILPHIQTERPAGDRFDYVVNERPDSEMIESVQMGLIAVENRNIPHQDKEMKVAAYLICPGDHPGISTQTIDACLAIFRRDASRLVLAVHQGKRGHPLIIPVAIAREVVHWPATERLNTLRLRYVERVHEVDVDDPGVLVDVDTPAELRNASRFSDGKKTE